MVPTKKLSTMTESATQCDRGDKIDMIPTALAVGIIDSNKA
eukprot:CAMPEP_0196816638 /NCGR_PEP_ID=MMETSP1362-20130617/56469_1 /TAXON_ID=163516 /ORGANISM="Leptocylindrus danicus, Strain CCMP1856" /LENGTH=40 /DNA_ID= /DNA_START= /DNA_END= /DNA_ORIENTATION=